MPDPLYTITIPEGATLAYLFKVLLPGRTAAATVELLFELYMRGEFMARGLPPNCRFIEENGALVVVDPDGKRFAPDEIKIRARTLYDPHHPTFEEEEPFPFQSPGGDEPVEREWEKREREAREAAEGKSAPSAPETDSSDPLADANSQPNVVEFRSKTETRGRKKKPAWEVIEAFVKNNYRDGRPDPEVVLSAIRDLVAKTKLEIGDSTIRDGLPALLAKLFPET